LKEICENAKKSLSGFWDEYRRLDQPHLYKVDLSDKLYELKTSMLKEFRKD
ncbi:MAG TPA: nicotinate phosphoribosyltransferase, partial [Clostridiales bacterium]|nr:nicotinate phosphoribosyltransferase [Clostridiales bacterium]